ncbi:hypothetical protein ACFLWZ_08445, partial [Chloroflexota bacterium]
SETEKELLQIKPELFIEQKIMDLVLTSPANRLPFLNDFAMWDEPLVKFADGDDPIFTEYKSIIAPTHLTPREALAKAYDKRPEDMPERLSVISWILPAAEETRKSNRVETKVPGRLWSHSRWYGEKFNDMLRGYLPELLKDLKYMAVAPMQQPYFEKFWDDNGMYSNWSERHIAYAAGQGTFSLSDGLITERGIAHRCGNVVTNLVLKPSPRTATGPYSNCLFYMGVDCKACIMRCPAGAITEKGHDKNKCEEYGYSIGYNTKKTDKEGYDNDTSVAGCGLCQTKVPCEFRNPVKKQKKTKI